MNNKKNKLRSCDPLVTQLATNSANNATSSATNNATVDLKSLALKGLKRNRERNQTATKEKKQRNSDASKVAKKFRMENCRKCYHHEKLPQHGSGCVHKINSTYQYQWSLLGTLAQCPLGYWN